MAALLDHELYWLNCLASIGGGNGTAMIGGTRAPPSLTRIGQPPALGAVRRRDAAWLAQHMLYNI